MMTHFVVAGRNLLLIFISMLVLACSDSNKTTTIDESFTVELDSTELTVEINSTALLNYLVVQETEFDINVAITSAPSHGTLAVDQTNKQISFMLGDQTGSGQFTLLFSSQTQTSEMTVNYVATPISTDPGTDDPDPDCTGSVDDCPLSELNPNLIYFPSNYITIFEGETVEIEIQRNYTDDDEVTEQFYFNSAVIKGQLSADKNSLIIEAFIGEEDTYGEIVAVTEKNGVVNESTMYMIYYNKNRDLETTHIPTLAVKDTTINVPTGQSTTLDYDLYDPDSDRIAYRIIKGPKWLTTHVNLTQTGIQITLYPIASFDIDDNEITVEISDAHNSSQTTFTLTSTGEVTIDEPPQIYLERNVDLSLLIKLQGVETDLIATLAFAAFDDLESNLEYSVIASDPAFSYRIDYPYVYVYSDDVTDLNHEQITIVASDGNFNSKLTYHLYIKNNFVEFLGGHPNSSPLIDVAQTIDVLETTGVLLPYAIADLELHDFTVTFEFDDSLLQVILENENLAITALPNETDDDIETTITLIATDEFGAQSSADINVVVKNNTPPVITYTNSIELVEGGTAEIQVDVTDAEEGTLPFALSYDTNKFAIVVEGSSLFVTALNVLEDYDGVIDVTAVDDFGELALVSIPAKIRFTNTAPVITAQYTEVSMLPGETLQMRLTYVDPDTDELNLFSTVNNSNLTYSYDPNTQILALAVSEDSPYEQEFIFSTSASDGFLSTFLNITVTVPIIPTPPELTVSAYLSNVSEGADLIINYRVFDINGDNIAITITNSFPNQLALTEQDGYIEVSVPDNVLVDTLLYFDITARDDSANAFVTTETVSLNVMPVNDPPVITLSENNLTLINDDIVSLPLSVVDIDNLSLSVEVRTPTSAIIPSQIVVHGADINSIRISGASKGSVIENAQLILRVYDDETYTEVPFVVSVILENEPPITNDTGSVLMLQNSTFTFNITPSDPDSATDGDVVSVVSVESGDPELLVIVGDPNSPPTNTVTVTSLAVTEETDVFVSVTITDGYVSVLKRIRVNIRP
ncbi:hypothetical protein KO525_05405 [Psychrosphaera sp. B3R10]|uniref:hypothetical protein n=1 Tax=unclassified Psychrosphaera TaxID=2641570 RepID=UPI001C08D32F|nr:MULTISPECIES: hypothetical protein [unclassified Psychrosphaera]MBU2882130.1 hypothetical protein [Psychrosphaera sp. I2R16]MBU2988811.1 hypothetical protein [Psychrosphaera sp. B3R10]